MLIMTIDAMAATAAEERTTPPPPAEPRQANLPKPVERTLANGLRVIVVSKHDIPLVSMRMAFRSGGAAEPENLAGLAQITSSLLTKGTSTRSAREIAEGVEALGASLDASAGWDSSNVDLSAMSKNVPAAFAWFSDVVLHPKFAADELERVREQHLDGLRVALKQPRSLAGYVAARTVFGGTAYGHPLSGTPESLTRIKASDVVEFHARVYRPDNAVLVFGGDIAPASAFALAEKAFGSWKAAEVAAPSANAGLEMPAAKARVIVIDVPDAGQAAVAVARPGIRRVDPAYYPALVANSILGGGYSSRLNQEIRIKRGLSYGAGSSFDARRNVGPFTASTQTKNESAVEVATLILDEMKRLGGEEVTAAELGPRKAVLIGGFGRSLETSSDLVARISGLAVNGLGLDEINKYISSVEKVTPADVQSFSASHLATSDASVIIVGDLKKFSDKLKTRFPDAEIIPLAGFDLNSPTLRK